MFLQEVVEYVRIEAKCPESIGLVQMQYRSASFNLFGRHRKVRDAPGLREENQEGERTGRKEGARAGQSKRGRTEGKQGEEERSAAPDRALSRPRIPSVLGGR